MQGTEPSHFFRTVCYALRHEPWQFGLELTAEGFTSLETLVRVIHHRLPEFRGVSLEEVEKAIRELSEERFEVRRVASDAIIRARYGHSFPVREIGEEAEPPEVLYHGTGMETYELIWKHGLHPMDRHYTHLTTDLEYALEIGEAKGSACVWRVNAKEAFASGIVFRKANFHVWLTSEIPPKFLSVETELSAL
jgi:putative RNA 2'-phosphotransferase